MKKYIYNNNCIFLFIVILLAFFLRSSMFLNGDFYMLADQGRDLQLVKQIVVDHKLTLIGGHAGFGGLFHGPLWWYMIVPFFWLAQGDPFYSLVPLYMIISLGYVIVSYFIGKKLYGKFSGLLFAYLIGISQTFINTISFTSNSQLMPLIFLLYLFCAIQYLRGNNKYIIGLFFFTALGINSESAFAIALIPLTLFTSLFRKKIPSIKLILISIIAFIIPVSSFILFDLRHDFLMFKSILKLLSGNFPQNSTDSKLYNLSFRMQDRLMHLLDTVNFIQNFGNIINKISSYFILLCAGFLTLLQIKNKKKFNGEDKELIYIFLVPVIVFITYMFIKIPIQGHWVMFLGISTIWLFILALRKIAKFNFFLCVLLLFFYITLQFIPVIQLLNQNFINLITYSSSSNGSYINQSKIVESIFKDAGGKPFGYFVFDLPIVTYSMDYLFWWRGKTYHNYLPKSEKLSTTYLILNPAKPGDLQAHDFWITHTIRTKAPVVRKWIMPGNVTILKLAVPKGEPPVDSNYYQNFIFR